MEKYEFGEGMSQPVIVAAACKNLKNDELYVGARHWDMVMRRQVEALYTHSNRKKVGVNQAKQGFIDQFGRFWNREDAFNIAKAAGQLEGREKSDFEDSTILYSEDLY